MQKTYKCQKNSEKQGNRGLILPDFKVYYTVIVIKAAWYWWKHRHISQWTKMESPKINSHGQLIWQMCENDFMQKG